MDDVMENHFYRLKRFYALIRRILYYYNAKQIPLASAALCYYMMMTFFPLIICLYTLLGNSYSRARRVLDFAENMLSADTVQTIRTFLNYVAFNHSQAMFIAGVLFLLTTASAGMRSIQATLGRMQGGHRFPGARGILVSVVFAVAFLGTTWFGILVMFTSRDLLGILNEKLPFLDVNVGWQTIKYLLMLAVSFLFSIFIAASARYSLVYGSLTSMILLMLWLFFSCQAMYIGAALNIAIRDLRGT